MGMVLQAPKPHQGFRVLGLGFTGYSGIWRSPFSPPCAFLDGHLGPYIALNPGLRDYHIVPHSIVVSISFQTLNPKP